MSSANPGIIVRWALVDSTTAAMEAAWVALKLRADVDVALVPAPPMGLTAATTEDTALSFARLLLSDEVECAGERRGERERPMMILLIDVMMWCCGAPNRIADSVRVIK